MSIQQLPQTTVRVLGSAQAITDPASLVKELIDNAIDAQATSVSVEIAANTLDVIQVRDNGHGVAPEDRAMICRRYCTSKIKSLADLRAIQGTWLGFRGEALASASELSGSLAVTTRVEGETTAVVLRVARSGETLRTDRASHPVGTTIRITDLFLPLPVRKQGALKATVKCIKRIKHLLKAYALARPSLRFCLRILKAQSDKSNWTYVPHVDAGIVDTAIKIVGKDCATQCRESTSQTDGFKIEALLPVPNGDATAINNTGCFLSVDGRPVSSARGTLHQMIKLTKEKMKAASNVSADFKDPFFFMKITCPPESYDVNVEPAKDDVVFDDSEKVIRALKDLLDRFYPEAEGNPSLQNRVPDTAFQVFEEQDVQERPKKRQRFLQQDYSTDDDDDENMLLDHDDQDHLPVGVEEMNGCETEGNSTNDSNPWIYAKMHSSRHSSGKQRMERQRLHEPLAEKSSPATNVGARLRYQEPYVRTSLQLPTPENSSSPQRKAGRDIGDPPDIQRNRDLGLPEGEEDDNGIGQYRLPQSWTAANQPGFVQQLPTSTVGTLPRHIRDASLSSTSTAALEEAEAFAEIESPSATLKQQRLNDILRLENNSAPRPPARASMPTLAATSSNIPSRRRPNKDIRDILKRTSLPQAPAINRRRHPRKTHPANSATPPDDTSSIASASHRVRPTIPTEPTPASIATIFTTDDPMLNNASRSNDDQHTDPRGPLFDRILATQALQNLTITLHAPLCSLRPHHPTRQHYPDVPPYADASAAFSMDGDGAGMMDADGPLRSALCSPPPVPREMEEWRATIVEFLKGLEEDGGGAEIEEGMVDVRGAVEALGAAE